MHWECICLRRQAEAVSVKNYAGLNSTVTYECNLDKCTRDLQSLYEKIGTGTYLSGTQNCQTYYKIMY